MNMHKNICLTQYSREAMQRECVQGRLMVTSSSSAAAKLLLLAYTVVQEARRRNTVCGM